MVTGNVSKIGEIWACDFWDEQVDSLTNRHTETLITMLLEQCSGMMLCINECEQLMMLCTDYPNSMYSGLMHGDSASSTLSVPADRLMPVHPDVRLKSLPFYDVITELLKPSTLREFQSCSSDTVSCLFCYLQNTLVCVSCVDSEWHYGSTFSLIYIFEFDRIALEGLFGPVAPVRFKSSLNWWLT